MKILVIGAKSPTTWLVFNAIRRRFKSTEILLEDGVSRAVFLRRRIKSIGIVKTIGQILFLPVQSFIHRKSRKLIATICEEASLNLDECRNRFTLNTRSINSPDCLKIVKNISPNLIIINGVSILSDETIKSFAVPILNLHCGITPDYRGVHGGYWALAMGDKENAGVTIHVVDAGIDTGAILYQRRMYYSQMDNICTYPYRQYSVGIPLMLEAISDFLGEQVCPVEIKMRESRLWTHPTIFEYLFYRYFRGVM